MLDKIRNLQYFGMLSCFRPPTLQYSYNSGMIAGLVEMEKQIRKWVLQSRKSQVKSA